MVVTGRDTRNTDHIELREGLNLLKTAVVTRRYPVLLRELLGYLYIPPSTLSSSRAFATSEISEEYSGVHQKWNHLNKLYIKQFPQSKVRFVLWKSPYKTGNSWQYVRFRIVPLYFFGNQQYCENDKHVSSKSYCWGFSYSTDTITASKFYQCVKLYLRKGVETAITFGT